MHGHEKDKMEALVVVNAFYQDTKQIELSLTTAKCRRAHLVKAHNPRTEMCDLSTRSAFEGQWHCDPLVVYGHLISNSCE